MKPCSGTPGRAEPDPCLTQRFIGGGDLEATLFTSHLSSWTVGLVGGASEAGRDFDGDGHDDVLWFNHETGYVAAWLMNGTSWRANVLLYPTPVPTEWRPFATGDLNGDGDADILWHNIRTGQVAAWLMNGTSWAASVVLYDGFVPLEWSPIGTGDFNGDDRLDILWSRNFGREIAVWYMDGTTLDSFGVVAYDAGGYVIPTSVADVDGDRDSDIVFTHVRTGDASAWLMDGTTRTASIVLGRKLGTEWKPLGAGDYNGDGETDILWWATVSRRIGTWLMNGATVGSFVSLWPDEIPSGWAPR